MPKPLDPALVDQIRASLYAGRGVRLFGDDEPTTKLEPSNPMTADGDTFFTSKLDKIAELLEKGFHVNIDSDGSILARTPDHSSRYISTQETEIDAMDRLMVKDALSKGAKVSFEADGSLVIDGSAGGTPPSAAHAAAMFAEFERIADAGDINAHLAAGNAYDFDASAVPDPAPPTRLEDPFDTAAEVTAEANALQLGVDVARDVGLSDFSAKKEAAEMERIAAERRLASAKAEREAAERQVAAAQAEATETAEYAVSMRQKAQKYRDEGDIAQADASEADARSFDALNEVQSKVVAAARKALDEADARIVIEQEAADKALVVSNDLNAEQSKLEQMYEDQEDQVFNARQAADELAEAERLEAALPELEARGVAGLDRVRTAIAEHRATAEQFIEKSRIRQETGITVTADLDENGIDPDLIEIEPNDQPAEVPATTPDNEIDPDLIEMEPDQQPAEAPATDAPGEDPAPTDAPTDVGIDPNLIEMDPPAAEFEPVEVQFDPPEQSDFATDLSTGAAAIDQPDHDADSVTDS